MKTIVLALAIFAASLSLTLGQARAPQTAPPPPPPPPPPVYPAATVPISGGNSTFVYEQKAVGAGPAHLVSAEQAQAIINRFKEKYQKLGNPRFLIYVNRELIDENSGLKLSSHKQVIESTRNALDKDHAEANPPGAMAKLDSSRQIDRVTSTNIYRVRERKEAALGDRETVRDVERLFGRPLRMAGATLVDQRVATQVIAGTSLDKFTLHTDSEQARKEREALAKVADVVLEILISSQDTTVSELAGERRYTAPGIQATAIRLSDAQILGQATAEDLIGQGPSAGKAAQTFGIREITEATALSLMEDMML